MRRATAAARLVRQVAAAAIAAAAGAAAPAAARAQSVIDRPPIRLPACANPARNVDWDTVVVYAGLTAHPRGAESLPQMYRLLILEEFANRLRATLATASRGAGEGGLPSADGHYSPMMVGNSIRLVLRGDGSIGSVALPADSIVRVVGSDTLFLPWRADPVFEDSARRVLEGMSAERVIPPPPDREPTDSFGLRLYVWEVLPKELPLRLDSTTASWPLFRLTMPRTKSAAPARGGRRGPTFPAYARQRRVQGTVVMQFVVNEDGRVEPRTIRDLRKPGDVPKKYETSYQAFVKSVRDALPDMKYLPAEWMGCRVRQLVMQPFAFGLGEP